MSEILRRVREDKESSDARSSNTRARALSTGTDVNKLTTSNDNRHRCKQANNIKRHQTTPKLESRFFLSSFLPYRKNKQRRTWVNEVTVIGKTGRLDSIDSAKSVLSKRPVISITMALIFLLLNYFRLIFIVFLCNCV